LKRINRALRAIYEEHRAFETSVSRATLSALSISESIYALRTYKYMHTVTALLIASGDLVVAERAAQLSRAFAAIGSVKLPADYTNREFEILTKTLVERHGFRTVQRVPDLRNML
jgi:hypothetical protein